MPTPPTTFDHLTRELTALAAAQREVWRTLGSPVTLLDACTSYVHHYASAVAYAAPLLDIGLDRASVLVGAMVDTLLADPGADVAAAVAAHTTEG